MAFQPRKLPTIHKEIRFVNSARRIMNDWGLEPRYQQEYGTRCCQPLSVIDYLKEKLMTDKDTCDIYLEIENGIEKDYYTHNRDRDMVPFYYVQQREIRKDNYIPISKFWKQGGEVPYPFYGSKYGIETKLNICSIPNGLVIIDPEMELIKKQRELPIVMYCATGDKRLKFSQDNNFYYITTVPINKEITSKDWANVEDCCNFMDSGDSRKLGVWETELIDNNPSNQYPSIICNGEPLCFICGKFPKNLELISTSKNTFVVCGIHKKPWDFLQLKEGRKSDFDETKENVPKLEPPTPKKPIQKKRNIRKSFFDK